MDNNTTNVQKVFLSEAEQVVYKQIGSSLMQSAQRAQALAIQRKKIAESLQAVDDQIDDNTDIAIKSQESLRALLQNYAFKYDKAVMGVNPADYSIVFADQHEESSEKQ